MTDLTTLAAFKAYSGITTNADDAAIGTLITAYSSAVRQYLNRDITATDYSRTFDGRNTTRQMVPQYPIISVASVQIGLQAVTAAPSFGDVGYRFDENSVILTGSRFERGEANVLIAWRAGYATVPADIAQAVNEWAGQRYALRDKQGWQSKTLAGETVTLMTRSMPDTVKMILDQWKAVVPL